MTALAGYWSFHGRERPVERCERMLRAQQAYAPDAPAIREEGAVALGRRLWRTLPEDRFDRGPVTGGGGRWTLVADVRLDDREALCDALGIARSEAAASPDAEIVMRAVERWEEEAFARLVGEFAVALWDRDRERLLLARDFLGQRPLHYHRGDAFFAFATMPSGLLALPEVPTGPDERSVAAFLALAPPGGTRSFFKGAERVPAGALCIVTPAGVATSCHWRTAPSPLRLKRSEDYVEAVREVFDRAVEARLRGPGGRVAAHLSGGLDSAGVAATAARRLAPDGRVVAFTSVPREGYSGRLRKGRFADEGAHAAAVAALYPNMEHVLVRTAGRSPLAGLDRNFSLYQRPVLNLCNAVWADAIMDAARDRGLKVLLTGQMGNMTVSYTGLESLPGLLARGRLFRVAREAVMLRRRGTRLISFASHAFGPLLPGPVRKAVHRLTGRSASLADHSVLRAEAAFDFARRPPDDPFALRLWALGRTDPGDYHKGALAGWGIDTRDPTADRRLVELCLSIPAEEYLAGGYTRALARRAFADRLPAAVAWETRKGYQAADWHEGLLAGWEAAREEAERAAKVPAAAGTVDMAALARLLERVPEGDWNAPAVAGKYRLALLRGLSAAHFARKAAGAN